MCQFSSDLDNIFFCKKGKFENFFAKTHISESNVKAIFVFHQIFNLFQLQDRHRATDYHVFLNFENWLINKKVKDIFMSRFHLVCGPSLGDFYIEKKGKIVKMDIFCTEKT